MAKLIDPHPDRIIVHRFFVAGQRRIAGRAVFDQIGHELHDALVAALRARQVGDQLHRAVVTTSREAVRHPEGHIPLDPNQIHRPDFLLGGTQRTECRELSHENDLSCFEKPGARYRRQLRPILCGERHDLSIAQTGLRWCPGSDAARVRGV